jgi:hypothetical protein
MPNSLIIISNVNMPKKTMFILSNIYSNSFPNEGNLSTDRIKVFNMMQALITRVNSLESQIFRRTS